MYITTMVLRTNLLLALQVKSCIFFFDASPRPFSTLHHRLRYASTFFKRVNSANWPYFCLVGWTVTVMGSPTPPSQTKWFGWIRKKASWILNEKLWDMYRVGKESQGDFSPWLSLVQKEEKDAVDCLSVHVTWVFRLHNKHMIMHTYTHCTVCTHWHHLLSQ